MEIYLISMNIIDLIAFVAIKLLIKKTLLIYQCSKVIKFSLVILQTIEKNFVDT